MHEKASKRTSRLTDYRRHGAARDAASRLSHRCSPPPPARARARRCGAEAQTRRAERAHLHRREQEAEKSAGAGAEIDSGRSARGP